MFQKKVSKPQDGFTLVEVLIAILIAIIFVTVAMQMMVIATVFRVRAQEAAEATTQIQKDLENIKYQAANYQYTNLATTANTGANSISVSLSEDFSTGAKIKIGSDTNTYTISTISGTTLSISPSLGTTQTADSPVYAVARCTGTALERFADGLRDEITGSDKTTSSNDIDTSFNSQVFTEKTYRIRKTITIPNTADDAPYYKLQINYDVSPTSGGTVSGDSIATYYTEVIPNAALHCPN
jgi:prepilin-type N-terminal cleavage/methylation domain-containing protein